MIAMLWLENRMLAGCTYSARHARRQVVRRFFHASINSRRADTYSRVDHEHIDSGSFINHAHPSIVYDVL